jgi:hypothetical protein
MANILKEIEKAGRGTDDVVGHLTVGEIVIPVQLAEIPEVKKTIKAIFREYGVSLNEFTVGNPENKINPETGYPEFFFKKIFKAIKNVVTAPVKAVQNFVQNPVKAVSQAVTAPIKAVSGAIKDVGKAVTGSGSKSNNTKSSAPAPAPANNADAEAIKKQMASDRAAFDKWIADQKVKDEENRKKAEQEAKDKAIAAESTRARGLAAANQQEIATQLDQTLNQPLNQDVTVASPTYTPSGYGADQPKKAIPGTSGGPTPKDTAATMPVGLMAQKINQDSGGTNMATNKFNIPNVQGLQFGGS